MYDLFLVALIIAAGHLGSIWVALNVLKLSYTGIVVFNAVFALLTALIATSLRPSWKTQVKDVIQSERADGELVTDMILMVATLGISAFISNGWIYKRYGTIGWLALIGSNVILNSIF